MTKEMKSFFDTSTKTTGLYQIFERFPKTKLSEDSPTTQGMFTTLVWLSIDKRTKETRFAPYEVIAFGLDNPPSDQDYFMDLFSELHSVTLSPRLSWASAFQNHGLDNKSMKLQNDGLSAMTSILAIQSEGMEALRSAQKFETTTAKGMPVIPTHTVIDY